MAIKKYLIDDQCFLIKELGVFETVEIADVLKSGIYEVFVKDENFPQGLLGNEILRYRIKNLAYMSLENLLALENDEYKFLDSGEFVVVGTKEDQNQSAAAVMDTGWRKIAQTGMRTVNDGQTALSAYARLETGYVRFRRINDLCFVSIGGGRYDSFTFSTQRPAYSSTGTNRWNLLEVPVGFRTKSSALGFTTNDGTYINGSFIVTSTTDLSLVQVKNITNADITSGAYLKTNILVYPTHEPFPEVLPGTAV